MADPMTIAAIGSGIAQGVSGALGASAQARLAREQAAREKNEFNWKQVGDMVGSQRTLDADAYHRANTNQMAPNRRAMLAALGQRFGVPMSFAGGAAGQASNPMTQFLAPNWSGPDKGAGYNGMVANPDRITFGGGAPGAPGPGPTMPPPQTGGPNAATQQALAERAAQEAARARMQAAQAGGGSPMERMQRTAALMRTMQGRGGGR